MPFVTRTGVSFGGVAGGPQPARPDGATETLADAPLDAHPAAIRASTTRSGSQRLGAIAEGYRGRPEAAAGVEWRPVNRFQKLAALTLATALGLVAIGVIVRATDSGLGCPDWPLCHGQLIPSLGDTKAWIEWIHRTVAVVIGFEILALAILAFRDYRDRRSILW